MGHHVHVFIGSRAVLAVLAGSDEAAHVFDLALGIAALPATWAWLNEACPPDGGPCSDLPFERLTEALATRARAASRAGVIAYAETDYFGGVGSQHAVVWKGGEVVASGSINGALAEFGVEAVNGVDAFDRVGLGEYRDDDRFFQRAGLPGPDENVRR